MFCVSLLSQFIFNFRNGVLKAFHQCLTGREGLDQRKFWKKNKPAPYLIPGSLSGNWGGWSEGKGSWKNGKV